MIGGGSYVSAGDRSFLVELKKAEKIDRVTVRYPFGKTQSYADLPARRWWRLSEGIDAAESNQPKQP